MEGDTAIRRILQTLRSAHPRQARLPYHSARQGRQGRTQDGIHVENHPFRRFDRFMRYGRHASGIWSGMPLLAGGTGMVCGTSRKGHPDRTGKRSRMAR